PAETSEVKQKASSAQSSSRRHAAASFGMQLPLAQASCVEQSLSPWQASHVLLTHPWAKPHSWASAHSCFSLAKSEGRVIAELCSTSWICRYVGGRASSTP